MSSHDELNKAIGNGFQMMDQKLSEARFRLARCAIAREALMAERNEIRSILAGDDGPEDKLRAIENLVKLVDL